MKRFVLLASFIVLLGGIFGYLLANKSSYVLLVYEQYAFETSLWFFLIVLFIVFFLFNRFWPLIAKSLRPKKHFQDWAMHRRVEASKRDFLQGLMDFETGAWDKALKKFQAAARADGCAAQRNRLVISSCPRGVRIDSGWNCKPSCSAASSRTAIAMPS